MDRRRRQALRVEREAVIALFRDDPDTTVVDPDELPRYTMIGLPAPARLPASPAQSPGAGYLRKYPVFAPPATMLGAS